MWWEPVVPVTLVAAGFLSAIGLQRRILQNYRTILELCGLEVKSMSHPLALHLNVVAEAGPVKVRITGSRRGKYAIQVTVAFPGPPGLSGVRIRREAYRRPGSREVEIGDPRFDGTFYVEGPTRLLHVLLDAETRRLLLEANDLDLLEVSGGELRVDTDDLHLANVLSLLLVIARRLAEPVEVAARLAENATTDPAPGVRLQNLLVLAREFPGESGTVEALRAACTHPAPQVRLRAAMELGAEGHAVLQALAEDLEGPCSAPAIARLGRNLPFEDTRRLLMQALRQRLLAPAHACLEGLGRQEDPAAVEVLAKVLAIEKGELATTAARALGTTGAAAAEPALLRALEHKHPDLRIAAAQALGRVGTTAAVLPLKEVAERSAGSPELARAARQAIAEIQSRLPGASPGQLSLAGDEAGRLSLTSSEAGQLSLPP